MFKVNNKNIRCRSGVIIANFNVFKLQTDSFILVTVSENIINIFKNTNVPKAAGLDNLSGRFLKDGAAFLAKPFTDLCNLSITSGKFPDYCKIANLKPIYKKGFLTEASNYRPISLLSLISKVIEKVIHDQTSVFLNSRYLLYNYQSGFCKNHSTDYCLSFLNDKILKGFDQGLITGMILIYKKPLIQSTMTFHCKNCMLLVSLNIQ